MYTVMYVAHSHDSEDGTTRILGVFTAASQAVDFIVDRIKHSHHYDPEVEIKKNFYGDTVTITNETFYNLEFFVVPAAVNPAA